MNRNWARVLVAPAMVGAIVIAAASAMAAPFVVGNATCGDLRKVRNTDGSVSWQLTGCAPLEDLIAAGSCGNGKVDQGEFCDTALASSCGTGDTCVACASCTSGPTPTPTPAPNKTPAPTVSTSQDCPEGVLPLTTREGYTGWRALTNIGLEPGEMHVYCVPVGTTNVVNFNAAEESPDQCDWFRLTVTPPPSTDWRAVPQSDTQRDPIVNYNYKVGRNTSPLPSGTWIVSIENVTRDLSCNGKYSIFSY